MSRSNPNEGAANPATRWFKWNGEKGVVSYYDKEKKENIEVPDFKFMLLDQLGSVRGWHDASESGIYSNEVKDTRQETMVVKAFKGGILAEGIYQTIKEKVNAQGGSFHTNCYIAFKDGKSLALGSIRFKGAALRAWMDFSKANRSALNNKAVQIAGYTEGQKGRVIFRVPKFTVAEVSPETDAQAVALDVELQTFLSSYLKRNKRDQVEQPALHLSDEDIAAEREHEPPPIDDGDLDSIPF